MTTAAASTREPSLSETSTPAAVSRASTTRAACTTSDPSARRCSSQAWTAGSTRCRTWSQRRIVVATKLDRAAASSRDHSSAVTGRSPSTARRQSPPAARM
ncbi:hypothetical protein [Parafrankia soli]|uniref:hypothetical protein n=1 Tax=Parafrankia soli TaxID=2599596 RepID=UPI001F515C92|nr:hypothetical protein [Parafrankia soli]